VNLKNVEISQANLKGMSINGVLVSDLFDAYYSVHNKPADGDRHS
jgi:hypothetical protein